ncbi:MAG: hypothetical protein HQK65_10025 [Desulfamplus sp.]|nr:hypothetical protein [Desulfamplus sp.]
MTFHRVIKSNDAMGCFTSILITILFGFGLIFLYVAFLSDDIVGKVFTILWNSLIGTAFLFALYHSVFPQKREIVMGKDLVRWGNVRKPDKQKRIQTKDIACICFDCGVDSDCTYAIMKDKKRIRLPDHIIRRKSNNIEFKEFLFGNFPDIEVRNGLSPEKA